MDFGPVLLETATQVPNLVVLAFIVTRFLRLLDVVTHRLVEQTEVLRGLTGEIRTLGNGAARQHPSDVGTVRLLNT
jgi:hypothetical protein